MCSSLLKFQLFKYYILIILLILVINIILLLHTNINFKPIKRSYQGSDIYEEQSPDKINKNYWNKARLARHSNVSNEIHREILQELDMLDKYFFAETGSEFIQTKYRNVLNQLTMTGETKGYGITSSHADELNSWLLFQSDSNQNIKKQPVKYFYSLISKISSHLCQSKVVRSDLLNKGTQLKFLLTLENKGRLDKSVAKMNSKFTNHKFANARYQVQAVFKPKWYENSQTFPNVVDGKDRHYGELIGFFLSILLEMYRAPLTVLAEFKMTDLVSTASESLNMTYFKGPGNTSCFQGKCLYCTQENAVCSNSTVKGALILYVENEEFHKVRHPYQRSYVQNVTKAWQTDPLFCFNRVAKLYDREFILDIVDIAVFDFLLQNGDRHHLEKVTLDMADYQEKENTIGENAAESKGDTKDVFLLFDNGKSFGNPAQDHLDILAPLYQCCILRGRTYNTLVQLRGGLMIRLLKSLSEQSACGKEKEEVMSDAQWRGMQRRLNLVYATVNYCVRKHQGKTILVS